MKMRERSYSSKIFRPKPVVISDENAELLVIATSWGLTEHAEQAATEIAKYVAAARGDVEVTSPFEFMTCLSDDCNHLRIGLQIANDLLYRGENRMEYVSGVEVVALARKGSHVSWAQVGAPHVLLRRGQNFLSPVATNFDHSFDTLTDGKLLPPLPSRLLGVDPAVDVRCGDLLVNEEDSLVLLASSIIPESMWLARDLTDLKKVTEHLSKQDAESPFWLGIVDFRD